MIFWICLVFVGLLCIVLEKLVPVYVSKNFTIALILILCFISAFRYMIGYDYEIYTNLFYAVDFDSYYPEFSFKLLAVLLREWGGDFQSIFFIYSLLTFVFLYWGIDFYSSNKKESIRMVLLFMLVPAAYLFSLNGIRQALAIVIFLWSTKFIITKEFTKYFFAILFASFWHYSVCILIMGYWIFARKYSKKIHLIFLIASVLITAFGIIPTLIDITIGYLGVYTTYVSDGIFGSTSFGSTFLFLIIIYIYLLYFKNNTTQTDNLLINMFTLLISFTFLLSFSTAVSRFKNYFEIFNIITFTHFFYCIKNSKNENFIFYIIILAYIIIFLRSIYIIPLSIVGQLEPIFSATNIIYEFNFKLLQ